MEMAVAIIDKRQAKDTDEGVAPPVPPPTRPTAEELQDLMQFLLKQTPSAPDWYETIDRVVGTLLWLEIDRRKKST